MKGIPHPPADPPGAAPAGVTVDVPAGISAAIASDLGWSGGNAIVVDLRELTTDRRGVPRRLHCSGRGSHGWKGRGPSAVDSAPLGRPQNIPIRASKGMTCPNLREIGSGRGRGFSLVVFPTPLLLVCNFRFGGIYLFGAVGVATLAAGARVGEGFIDSGEVVPTAV